MPVAYSELPIVKASIRCDTAAHAIADLDAILTSVGWVHLATLPGGFVYTVESPQGFLANVLIQDDIHYKADYPLADLYNFRSVVLQVYNIADTFRSFPYQLQTNAAYSSMQVVAGICQLFVSVPGLAGGGWGSVACGIPFVPEEAGPCVTGLAPVVTDDVWWANGGSQFAFDWRAAANCYACSTYYRNGVGVIAADNNNVRPLDGLLCLFPLTATNTYSVAQISWPTITYSTHNVLNIDAFVGWGWSIRGQLWDAFLQTAATTLDQIQSFNDVNADGDTFTVRAITWHSQFSSSLQLIWDVEGGSLGNVAY